MGGTVASDSKEAVQLINSAMEFIGDIVFQQVRLEEY